MKSGSMKMNNDIKKSADEEEIGEMLMKSNEKNLNLILKKG